mmetsp:Transcript_54071/g.114842  ORF Transcript_54071/g.114842 Transcript_54071/m.114842 type:complete len:196 (+) Transcript_54071:172-759(+)|eukprot:CAMPEP_0172529312 /NCGR_PEP_ID=MMETSP1067-20121228/3424_1 /TAXON_ID=265564 ORGANISM="Thalassiosira punctigera, Strain Tpunct2005C2" /NCGR_SAMPLE_ID=MMETSP1067 /ASSEMBLY_ACC=CAM_ASM_000444 /LENGTH=195 /DNA_ID=CAMNT_0013313343 /DNA_START=302 /DNA_END=889 /DNA_ORIENTATION=-
MMRKRKFLDEEEIDGGSGSRRKTETPNDAQSDEEGAGNGEKLPSKRKPTIPAGKRESIGNFNNPRYKAILMLPRGGPIKYVRQGMPLPKFLLERSDLSQTFSRSHGSHPEAIFIGIRDEFGEEEVFCLKKTIRMEWLFKRYALKKGKNSISLRFLVRGKEVGPDETATTLGFKNVGHIDCREKMVAPPMVTLSST